VEELKKTCKGFSREALTAMIDYNWPGNVRELKNVVRQAVLLCDDKKKISPEDLNLGRASLPHDPEVGTSVRPIPGDTEGRSLKEIMQSFTGDLEKRIIEETIRQARGNKSEAARRLAIDYKTLLRKIKAHRIE
jgi:DNA-binding NtrC family response regulator